MLLRHSSVDVTMELVGSCCTLVAEKLLSGVTFDLDTKVAQLLLGTSLQFRSCGIMWYDVPFHMVLP